MLTRLAVVTALFLAATATPAFADDWWGQVDCNPALSGCDLAAGGRGEVPSQVPLAVDGTQGGARPTSITPPCVPVIPSGVTDPAQQQAWREFACQPPGSASSTFDGPQVAPADLAEVARARLRLPAPHVVSSPGAVQLVRVPTWLWLVEGWTPMSATAAASGASVTALARPESAVWSMGDGAVITCMGAGTPYAAGGDPARSSPDCGHTYRRSSGGRGHAVTVTVRWQVTWSGAGQSGRFPDMSTTATTLLRVVESQAITTG